MSKIPVGPRGFNGSQGPIGPAGPQGFNGTQGSQGFNGSQGPQGPKGAGDFSQCVHKTEDLVGNQSPITSNSIANPVKVIKGEPRVSSFKGEIHDEIHYSLCNLVDNEKCKDVCQLVWLTFTQMKTWVTKSWVNQV